jgi:hypothetical protein
MDQPTAPTPPPKPPRPAVSWEPPVLAAPPPPPARTLPVPAIVAVCLAVVFAAGVVSVAVVRKLVARAPGASSAGFDPANDWRSPDELMRIGNKKGGLSFRRQLARAAERATKRSVPGSLIAFDEAAVIDDLGSTMRGTVGYRGRTSQAIDEGVHVDGRQRHYFHPRGAVIVDAVCVTGLSDCERRDLILDATEGAILDGLDQPGVDALLPASGRCEVESKPFAGTLATCQFDDEGLVLSIQKLSLEETRRAMQGLAGKPAAR